MCGAKRSRRNISKDVSFFSFIFEFSLSACPFVRPLSFVDYNLITIVSRAHSSFSVRSRKDEIVCICVLGRQIVTDAEEETRKKAQKTEVNSRKKIV